MADVLVLGSASPARAALLRSSGIEPVIIPSGVDEAPLMAQQPDDARRVAQRLARAKAEDVTERVRQAGAPAGRVLIVAADSLLEFQGAVLGKAESDQEVRRRWAAMAGGHGTLVTGHAVVDLTSGRTEQATVATEVRFGRPEPEELAAYIASGEPQAVAGSCTIDGLGAAFIDGVVGDHTNVIGLSLPTVRRLLRRLGVRWTDLWHLGRVPDVGL